MTRRRVAYAGTDVKHEPKHDHDYEYDNAMDNTTDSCADRTTSTDSQSECITTTKAIIGQSQERVMIRKASFQARISILDREGLDEGGPPMRGFLALFWVSIALYAGVSMYRNSAIHYMGVSLALWRRSYRDFEALLIMIAAIYLCTHICLPYQIALSRGWLRLSDGARATCRFILQAIPIGMALFVAHYREWPHLQTGSLLLFSISMNMKMHSFLHVNEILDRRREKAKVTLRSPSPSPYVPSPSASPSSSSSIAYPKNLTISNFTLYLWYPTLIYALDYPRTRGIRWGYLIERTLGTAVIFCLYYVILSHYVHPVLLRVNDVSFLDAFVDLLLPCLVSALLCFFLVFEYLLNWAAEITCFADRKFYSDWWNSTDMAEFARKWNVPVHRFLRCHVYSELLTGKVSSNWNPRGVSRGMAQFLTFFYSSLLHELVMSATAKRLKFWMLAMQMSQIPLMYMSGVLRLKRHPFLANLIWWLMITLGIPVLVLLYARETIIY